MPLDRSYQETIDYLFALQKHGIKLALSNSVLLMEIMGGPHGKFSTVHVAGTNGKGSTSAFLASMLMAAGYRVGLYTSPHLVSFTERIRINNVPIPEARVVGLAKRVREGYDSLNAGDRSGPVSPTFFEVTTAIAFTYFAEEGIDIAVIEVGMGGRLDSTNVITPLVSVITNIDLEHTEFLGNTLEQIAAEKAGIIKPAVPVVTGAVQHEVLAVIERDARAQGSPVYRLSTDFMPANITAGLNRRFDYRGIKTSYGALTIGMVGRYQVDNACLALAALECLHASGIVVDEPAVRSGLRQARWEGRMERVARRPDIYLDGAHNPASAQQLAASVREMLPAYRKLVLVIGILVDKNIRGILGPLVPLADRVVVTKPQYSRALDVPTLAAEVRKLHGSVLAAETLVDAIGMAKQGASADDLILVTGSLYVVGDARARFAPQDDMTVALKCGMRSLPR
jgi:dihydrofolate synthase/folylpolyglutamate synthase